MKDHKETKERSAAPPAYPEIGPRRIGAVRFICDGCVMVIEMAGSRILAPFIGTSLVVWTALIGVIMASMTIGYWAGGRIADRRPDPRLLSHIIAAAAVWTALIGLVCTPLLTALSDGMRDLYSSSILAALCLFAVPSLLLGMATPFCGRLAISRLGTVGSTLGLLSAIGSSGSIVGTFLGGFVLVSFFSTKTIIFLAAAALAAASLLLWGGARKSSALIAAAAIGLGTISQMGAMPMTSEGVDIETRYNTVHIQDITLWLTNREVRILQTNPISAQSLMYLDDHDTLYSDYTKFYELAFHYRPETKRVLMLGGGGYCVPRWISATKPDVAVDVVELDPGITQVARDFFFLRDREGQRIFHEDARIFLNRESAAGEKYDAVFGDVFSSAYHTPFQLTTTECAKAIYDLLDDGGLYIANVISEIGGELFAGIYSGIAEHFDSIMVFPATYPNSASTRQNLMIVAIKAPAFPDIPPASPQIAALLKHRWTAPYEPRVPAFHDDFAPVERYAFK